MLPSTSAFLEAAYLAYGMGEFPPDVIEASGAAIMWIDPTWKLNPHYIYRITKNGITRIVRE